MEKDDGLDVQFSKGTLVKSTYRIGANEYASDNEPIIVTLSSDKPGEYSFSLSYLSSSPGLEAEFEGATSIEFPKLVVQAKWKSYIIYIVIIVILLALVIFLFIKRRNEANSFDTGFIQLTSPVKEQIELSGKSNVNFSKIIGDDDVYCLLACRPDYIDSDDQDEAIKIPVLEVDDARVFIDGSEELSDIIPLRQDCKVEVVKEDIKILVFDYSEF
ncbi:MAG: hypothetical protein HEP71_03390 [Roseivirga sp.]|nr:hypothetical protein [Roseivirga sp.]